MAKSLELTPKIVDATHPKINIGAKSYTVWGIIDGQKLNQHVGMDGEKILPYDLNTVQSVGLSADGSTYVVPETIGRMTADRVVITSAAPVFDPIRSRISRCPVPSYSRRHRTSCARTGAVAPGDL